jgi:uncharacterized membrane protein YraQ (UPF0718 family)
MDSIFTYIIYAITAILLVVSLVKSKRKTVLALKKSWRMFLSMLPQFLAILFFIGLLLAVVSPDIIRKVIGAESGIWGMLLSAVTGAVALIPVLVAFPVASQLMQNGAGFMQIAVFISTLTTVGLITIPLESKYLGKKVAILRNALFFIFSFAVALVVGVVMG